MLSFFRRVSKSKLGTIVMALVLVGILAGFALADLQNFGTGSMGFGMGDSTLAKVGNQKVSSQDIDQAMQKRLSDARAENPGATYASIASDFTPLLSALIDQKSLLAFADKINFFPSKRLIDAQIAQIPNLKGLNGQFSDQAYRAFLAQQRLSDAQLREIIAGNLVQQLLVTPVAANARTSVGMAKPYASMMLEAREGTVGALPYAVFSAGLTPSDADLQRYYAANRARYIVPEQRVVRFATLGPEQVAVAAASEAEIASYYNANKSIYAPSDTRNLTQAVIQDQATANAVAARAKGGATLAAAAAPAGGNAAVTALTNQSRSAYASVAGDKAANAVFGATSGTVVGPVQSDFGWIVAKIDAVTAHGGKTLAQATPEIVAKLKTEKSKSALEDLSDKVQAAIDDDGANFAEAAAIGKMPVTTTPLIDANGKSAAQPGYALPAQFKAALRTAFDLGSNEAPEFQPVDGGKSFVLVAPGQIVPASPAPLATIRARVTADWLRQQGIDRARAAANVISAKLAKGVPFATAMQQAGKPLPPLHPIAARRIQIALANTPVPPGIKILFSLTANKSQVVPDPKGSALFIVKVDKITPGDAAFQPTLISQLETELQRNLPDDYARQFVAAVRKEMGLKRNEQAIQANKARITATAS